MVRSLADRTFQPRCALPWCFVDVDAADCDADTAEESLAFRGSGLHYSYAHCGVEPYQYHLAMYLAATSANPHLQIFKLLSYSIFISSNHLQVFIESDYLQIFRFSN